MKSTGPTPELGQIVAVRQRLYLVEQSVPPVNPGDSTLIQLSCVDDDAQGQPLEVLWERELDGQVITGEAWDSIASRGFDPPQRFAAYLNTLRWNCVTSTDPQPSPVAVPRRHPSRPLPARTACAKRCACRA